MNETLTVHKENYRGHLIWIDQVLVPDARFIASIDGEKISGWSQSWSVVLNCAKGVLDAIDAKKQRDLAFKTKLYQT